MKKYSSFLITLLCIIGCAENKGYQITGTAPLAELNGEYLYLLEFRTDDQVVLDSALVENNSFSFSGKQDQPALRVISPRKDMTSVGRTAAGENPSFMCVFILENAPIQVTLDEVSYATGTPENDALKELQDYLIGQRKEQKEISADFQSKTDEEKETVMKRYNQIEENIKAKAKEYINNHTDKLSGGKLLFEFRHSLTEDERRDILDKADATFVSVPTVQPVIEHLETLDKVAVGKKFTDFKMNDINGVERSLSDYVGNGKIVVIDFWASWCPPCRAEMPELVRIYNEYKNKGVDFIGISLDNSQQAWEKGIKDLSIPWTQLSDLKGWKNAGAGLYGVNSIPHLVLVDKDGTIIAKNLHGEELENKIKETLSN